LRTLLVFIVVVFIIGVPIFLSRLSTLRINTIEISGNTIVRENDVRALAEKEVSGSYMMVFPKSNSIILSKKKIKEDILASFPRILSVETDVKKFTKLVINIVEREPSYLWCASALNNNCFLVDSEGFVFDEAPVFSGDLYFIFREGLLENPIGQYILPEGKFKLVTTFLDKTKELGLRADSLVLKDTDEYILETKGGGKIVFSLEEDVNHTLSNLESVLLDKDLGVYENGELIVKMIDLRYGNKVIIKRE
jgi:hypothetical protein